MINYGQLCHETSLSGMFFLRVVGKLRLWSRNAKTRQRLAHLDERALRDVGLLRSVALLESERPFWR